MKPAKSRRLGLAVTRSYRITCKRTGVALDVIEVAGGACETRQVGRGHRWQVADSRRRIAERFASAVSIALAPASGSRRPAAAAAEIPAGFVPEIQILGMGEGDSFVSYNSPGWHARIAALECATTARKFADLQIGR